MALCAEPSAIFVRFKASTGDDGEIISEHSKRHAIFCFNGGAVKRMALPRCRVTVNGCCNRGLPAETTHTLKIQDQLFAWLQMRASPSRGNVTEQIQLQQVATLISQGLHKASNLMLCIQFNCSSSRLVWLDYTPRVRFVTALHSCHWRLGSLDWGSRQQHVYNFMNVSSYTKCF